MNNIRTYQFKFFWFAYLLFLCTKSVSTYCQDLVYQETFYGGVTGAGFSTGMGTGSGNTIIHVEPGSIIKKVFMIHNRIGFAHDIDFIINDSIIRTDTSQFYNIFTHTNSSCNKSFVYFRDITEKITFNSDTISIIIPIQSNPICWIYNAVYFIVLYEKPNMAQVNISILLNDADMVGNEIYTVYNLNPFNTNYPLGFALFSDRSEEDLPFSPKKEVYFNSNLLGLVGGTDAVNTNFLAAGVKGHFYYQNNQLFGLDDDLPNSTMVNTDGLADVSSYITNNATSCNFHLKHVSYPFQQVNRTHYNLAYFLTYATPCDTFSTTLTENVSICKGDTAFLEASGGIAYEWLPQEGLSCYSCPNPYYTDTVSRIYTCRIWNTDSCSKVMPVRVEALSYPTLPIITTTPTMCYDTSGAIHISNAHNENVVYTLNGGNPLVSGDSPSIYNELTPGGYEVQISTQTTPSCSIDTTVYVEVLNSVSAQFIATPQQGEIPLEVSFTNQSLYATNYIWLMGNDTLYSNVQNPMSNLFKHIYDSAGVYNVTLVAYHTYPQCADTAMVQIVAEYPLTIITPSLYAGDENYTPYQIYTSGVKELHYELFTTEGKLVYNKALLPTAGYVSLWNSNQLAKGIYLYRIWVVDDDGVEKVITGKVVVM